MSRTDAEQTTKLGEGLLIGHVLSLNVFGKCLIRQAYLMS